MTRNRNNVLAGAPNVAVSGGFFAGPVITDKAQYPKDATTTLPDSLKSMGFISEDGVTKTVDRSTEQIKDWNLDLVAVLTSEHNVQLQATFLEAANADVLKMIAGEENVTVEGNKISVKETSDDLPHRSIAFEIKGAGRAAARVFAADVQVSSVGDISFTKADLIKYEVTFDCFADLDNAKLHTFFETDPAVTTPEEGGTEGGGV